MKTFFLSTLLSLSFPFSAKADVNMKNASYFKTWIDLEIRKDAHIFQLRRTYNSRSLHPGLFGFGWCTDFEKSLELNRSDQIILYDCRLNAPLKFKRKKENLYESPSKETIEFKEDHYLRTTTKKTLQKFDKLGKLTRLIDPNENRLDFIYEKGGPLRKIIYNKDVELNIKFDTLHRHIQAITSDEGSEAHYSYENQNLVDVRNSWKNFFVYHYDGFHNLIRILYPGKVEEILTYDSEKDWILRIDRLKDSVIQCTEIFKYTQENNSNYSSTAEKICAGKTIAKTIYEFRHKTRADGSKYLDQVKISQGGRIQRISYQNR
ncbi:MAG: DUF6531 domain-containing protein [Pseudobdellovibrionaceae bacterium]